MLPREHIPSLFGSALGALAFVGLLLAMWLVAVWAIAEVVQVFGGGVFAGTAAGAGIVTLVAMSCPDPSGRPGQ